jgi:hypothetical protein
MAKSPARHEPGTAQTNRVRRQGLGMGQRDLETQRDQTVYDDEVEIEAGRLDPDDDGLPTSAQHSENHTRRPIKTEAARGQGPKTRAANRERVKGSRLFNPR